MGTEPASSEQRTPPSPADGGGEEPSGLQRVLNPDQLRLLKLGMPLALVAFSLQFALPWMQKEDTDIDPGEHPDAVAQAATASEAPQLQNQDAAYELPAATGRSAADDRVTLRLNAEPPREDNLEQVVSADTQASSASNKPAQWSEGDEITTQSPIAQLRQAQSLPSNVDVVQLAAHAGNALAMYQLSRWYSQKRNEHNLARRWMVSSAKAGYRPAMYEIAEMYLASGDTRDTAARAYAWFTIAQAFGVETAEQRRLEIAASAEAQALKLGQKLAESTFENLRKKGITITGPKLGGTVTTPGAGAAEPLVKLRSE